MPANERRGLLATRLDLGLRARAAEWGELFVRQDLGRDVGQGLLLAATTLPLSMLLATLAGAPASSGVLSAAIGSAVCVLMGGTRIALSGPGLTSALVSSAIIADHGLDGLGMVLLLVGALHVVTGALGLARIVRLAPLSVLRACVFGIALVVLVRSAPHVLAGAVPVEPDEALTFATLAAAWEHVDLTVLLIPAGCALLGMLSLLHRWIPGALLALIAAPFAVHVLGMHLPTVYETDAFPLPRVPSPSMSSLLGLLGSVFDLWATMVLATAINTAALERLKADIGVTEPSDPDQELIGNGLATMLLTFFHGLPATQLVARSAIGVRLGVSSRRPALIQALALGIAVVAGWRLCSQIPLAGLAGVAVAVSLPLLDLRPLYVLGKVSPAELGISAAAVASMVLWGIATGLLIGLALAFGLVALRMTRTRAIVQRSKDPEAPHQVTFSGPLTFLAGLETQRFRRDLQKLDAAQGLVVDMRSVLAVDGNGALSLLYGLDEWRGRGGRVALLGPSAPVKSTLLRADETKRPLPPGVEAGRLAGAVAVNDRMLGAILEKPGLRLARHQLLAGLTRFRHEMRGHYDSLFAQLADGQDPHTMFITCADSRINPSLLMGSHPGDLFIVRAIGALVPPCGMEVMPQEGAAIEYGVGVLGVRTIVVCGHSKCGAISALKNGKVPPELTTLNTWSRHAAEVAGEVESLPSVDDAIRAVTRRQIDNLMTYPLVREKHAQGELQIHAWFYDLGEVELFEWDAARQEFVVLDADLSEVPPPASAIVG